MPRGRPKKSEKSATTEPNLNPVIIENVKNETLDYPNMSKEEVYEIKGKVKTISAMSRQSISYRGNYYTFEYKEERELPINECVDLIQENEADVEELLDLRFGQTKLVLAAPEDSNVNSVEDITEDMKVATEFPVLTRKYLDEKGLKDLKIVKLSGSTEAAPFIGIADLITDLTSTGTTLKMNHLEIIDIILESSIKLIANKDSLQDKKELIEAVSTSIKGVLDADRKKLIMMNVKDKDLDKVKEVMPSMGGLTISEVLSNEKTVAVQAVIDEKQVFELVNDLKNAGAKDILVVPIERII
jgi:ATP phosphoribosyltransferase